MPFNSAEISGVPFLVHALLPAWLPAQRWFRSKSRAIASVSMDAAVRLEPSSGATYFTVARAVFEDGSFERYALPLTLKTPEEAEAFPPSDRIGASSLEGATGIWCDAGRDPAFHLALYKALSGAQDLGLGRGVLRGAPLSLNAAGVDAVPTARLLSAEQSNTSFAYSNGFFAKLYRRLEAAVNPEPETLRFLRRAGYPHVPAFASSLEWLHEGEAPVTVALLQDWVSSRGDAWTYLLGELHAAKNGDALPESLLSWASTLGERVAEMHNALASGSGARDAQDAFAPEPVAAEELEALRARTRASLHAALFSLAAALPRLDAATAALARGVLAGRERLEARIDRSAGDAGEALKIRTHGDLHLGQILVSAEDPRRVWILDFEGEPGRPLADARRKHPPARDAAGMMRSFHYAAHVALPEPALRPRAEIFAAALGGAFREAYQSTLRVPSSPRPEDLLEAYTLEKAVYELRYELDNRPDWAAIPLLGMQQLLTEYR